MAYTTTQLQALEDAIALGALSVKYADKTVTYRSLDEMIRIRAAMRTELGLNETSSGRFYMKTSKGLNSSSDCDVEGLD